MNIMYWLTKDEKIELTCPLELLGVVDYFFNANDEF